MQPLLTMDDYAPVSDAIGNVLLPNARLPGRVFNEQFKFFLFITFDELLMPLFFNNLKLYLSGAEDKDYWVAPIHPDPKSYFHVNFGSLCAFQMSSSDSEKDYFSILHAYPAGSPADALAHNANLLLLLSRTSRWVIYGDRDVDLAVCAFRDSADMRVFKNAYGADLLNGVEGAGEYAYGSMGLHNLKMEFCNNYRR